MTRTLERAREMAAVDGDRLTGDVTAGVGREEQHRAIEVARRAEAALGDALHERVAQSLLDEGLMHVRLEIAGRERVHADAVPRELDRHDLGEMDERGLGCGVAR